MCTSTHIRLLANIMRFTIYILFIIVLSSSKLMAQNINEYDDIIKKAEKLYINNDFNLSLRYYETAFKINKSNRIDLYNAACSAALSKDSIKASFYLDLAIKNGYSDWEHLKSDCDLKLLRKNKGWNNYENIIKKSLDSKKILETIIESIKDNDFDKVWELTGDEYKEKHSRSELKKIISAIHGVLKKSYLKQINNTPSQVEQLKPRATIYHNNISYCILPKIIEKTDTRYVFNFEDYLLGDKLVLKIYRPKNSWKISKIDFTVKEIKESIIFKKYFTDFTDIKDSLNYTYTTNKIDEKSSIRIQKKIPLAKSKKIEKLIVKIFDKIEIDKNFKPNYNFDTKNITSITLYKKDYSKPSLFSLAQKEVLQVIFLEDTNIVIFGKNKYEYGCFKLKDSSFIKELKQISF